MRRCFLFLMSTVLTMFLPVGTVYAVTPVGSDIYVQIKPYNVTMEDLDKIAASGFAGVRTSILWYKVEKERGTYSYHEPENVKKPWNGLSSQPLTYERLTYELVKRKLKMLVLLHGGNPNYTGGWQNIYLPDMKETRKLLKAPASKEEIQAFSKFAAHTVSFFTNKYGSEPFVWLIWNEPDLAAFYPPAPQPEAFSDLFLESCKAIRQSSPDAKIAGPGFAQERGVSAPDYDFMTSMLDKNNVLGSLDYMTFHPYRPGDPESVVHEYQEIRQFLDKYQPARKVPIAVDEWGYPNIRGDVTRTPEIQANRIVRMYLLNQLYGIPFTNIYEWKNRGDDPTERNDNYGLLDFQGKEKPGYVELASVLYELKGYSLEKRIHPKNCTAADYVLVYKNNESVKAALWSTEEKKRAVKMSDGTGREINTSPLSAKVNIVKMPYKEYEQTSECVPAQ